MKPSLGIAVLPYRPQDNVKHPFLFFFFFFFFLLSVCEKAGVILSISCKGPLKGCAAVFWMV